MKIKIKTYLWSGIVMGLFSAFLLFMLPSQIRLPAYDSGAPSPRIIPGVCVVGILVCSIILIIQSLVFKKEKIYEFDWKQEKPVIFITGLLCLFVAIVNYLGFCVAVVVIFPILLFYCGERKPPIYIFTLAAGIGVYFLFKYIFNVSLPNGILSAFF